MSEQLNKLPARVLATWRTEDWDDRTMTASQYEYFAMDNDGLIGDAVELTEEQANRYTWGQTEDNITGGSQLGELR